MSKNFWTSLFFVYGVCVCVYMHICMHVCVHLHMHKVYVHTCGDQMITSSVTFHLGLKFAK